MKKEYTTPTIEHIIIDNEISLILQSEDQHDHDHGHKHGWDNPHNPHSNPYQYE